MGWFGLVLGASLFMDFDIATNSLFMAKAVKTDECFERLSYEWRKVLSKSMLRFAFCLPKLNFGTLAFIAWLLMLFQLLFALMNAIPMPCGPIPSYDYQKDGEPWTYVTLATKKQHHRAAFQALAESSRMISVVVMNWDYVFNMSKRWEAVHIYREAKRKVAMFFSFMVLEQMCQLQLQVSALALHKRFSHGRLDIQTVFSIALGVIVTVVRLVTGFTANYKVQGSVRNGRAVTPTDEHCKGLYIDVLQAVFTFFWILSASLTVYAICKMYMVVFVCDGGWNLSGCI